MKPAKLLPLAGILLFVWILSGMDLPDIISALFRADLRLFLSSLAVAAAVMLAKAFKWRALLKAQGTDAAFTEAVRAWLSGYFLGIITPGRIGEVSRAHYLRGRPAGRTLASVAVDRLQEMSILLCFAAAGAIAFSSSISGGAALLGAITMGLLAMAVLVAVFSRKGPARAVLRPFSGLPFIRDRRGAFHDFYSGIGALKDWKVMAYTSLLTVLAWALTILQYDLLALSIGLELAYPFLFLAIPVVIVLDALPVSVMGIGTRDAALVFFFSLVSLSPESAVSFSLLMLMVYAITALVGLLAWSSEHR